MILFQLAHGADPFLKNQEGQSPADLATADDVKCLLQDAMASQQGIATSPPARLQSVPVTTPVPTPPSPPSPHSSNSELIIMPSGTPVPLSIPVARIAGRTSPMPAGDGCCSLPDCQKAEGNPGEAVPSNITSVSGSTLY